MKRRVKKDDRINSKKNDYRMFNSMIMTAVVHRKDVVKEIGEAWDFIESKGYSIRKIYPSYSKIGYTFLLGGKGSKAKSLIKVNDHIKSFKEDVEEEKERIDNYIAEHTRYLFKIFFKEPEKYI